MSEEDIKKEVDESMDSSKTEISEVTITEYRKNQIVRLVECFVVSPLCIYAGIRHRKELPAWLSTTLVVVGAGTMVYNSRNLYINWKQDGKLIREAIKAKKVEERIIRDRLKKPYGSSSKTAKSEEDSTKHNSESRREATSAAVKGAEELKKSVKRNTDASPHHPLTGHFRSEQKNGEESGASIEVEKIELDSEPIADELRIIQEEEAKEESVVILNGVAPDEAHSSAVDVIIDNEVNNLPPKHGNGKAVG